MMPLLRGEDSEIHFGVLHTSINDVRVGRVGEFTVEQLLVYMSVYGNFPSKAVCISKAVV